ncbi:type II secretion system F family protein [Rhodococcus sp. NPDC058505]|uniref:type II secretion system F family protein n=1 Tax=unclassified Rhodococcus (in: high G+C Gram-positive bacteria) TaxID=192944 RepID=UPI0036576D0C
MIAAAGLALALAVLAAPGPTVARRRVRSVVCRDTRRVPHHRTVVEPPDPLAVAACHDLFAACMRAGLTTAAAASAVSERAPEPLAGALRRAANLLALGAEPDTAWQQANSHPEVEALSRIARRSARSGSALAEAMTELAADQRAAVEDRGVAAAERAGVLISGPLGLCFLPAFLCLGIAPVVIGLAAGVLDGGLL